MPSFALVTEGITDQIVIENILVGFFDDPNIDITRLQPAMDETDRNRATTYGNWDQVLKYCSSKIFREAFQFAETEYVVIQIDTDVATGFGVGDKSEKDGPHWVEELILDVKAALIKHIGQEFYNNFASRILFAISVHSIECWLLPLFFTDNKKSKTVSCLRTLNQGLKAKKPYSIDPKNKNRRYYEDISAEYNKHRKLMQLFASNPSLEAFVHELEKAVVDGDPTQDAGAS